MAHIVENKVIKSIFLVLAIGLSGVSALAADISEKIVLPKRENCNTAEYISDQWNVDTKRTKANNVHAYKKLICKSGREAFILLWQDGKKPAYKLVDHSNYKVGDKSAKMCVMVNKYCSQ